MSKDIAPTQANAEHFYRLEYNSFYTFYTHASDSLSSSVIASHNTHVHTVPKMTRFQTDKRLLFTS